MAVVSTTQSIVLAAVVTRLKAQVSELNGDSLCYVSDYPEPPAQATVNLFALVSPSDGNFDVEIQEGAGNNDLRENSGVLVSVFSKVKLDRHGRTESLLQDATRGMLPLKQKILKALASHNLVDGSGNELLDAYMHALNASAPRWNEAIGMGVMSILFRADFAWDLT